MFITSDIYVFIAMLSSFFAFFVKKNKFGKMMYFCSFLVVVIFAAIRKNVSADYSNYIGNFINIGINGGGARIEPGYWLLNRIVGLFTSNLNAIIIVTSIITFSILFKIIREYSVMPALSVLFLFVLRDYEMLICLIRQGIALAIIAYSFKYLVKDEYLKYFVLVIIASSFHYSAIIFLLIFKILNKKMEMHDISIFIFIGITIFFARFSLGFLESFIHSEYYSSLVSLISEPGPVYLKQAMLNFFILILSISKYKQMLKETEYSVILVNILFLNTVMSFSLLGLNLAYRFVIYFDFFNILLYPLLIKVYIPSKIPRILITLLISIFLIIRFYQLLPISMYMPLPYQTIFN
ncbi:EpsG family protein [Enterococcus gallinarum]|uniref:EpsG family protein n=1 Tax=Enterococcus gallinarum TaxID=1353 RepID=UPI000BBCBC27|nr:EpsG family protein [Enterococcus gallinarum]MUN91512.1 hypothetical protein [Enterococcus gallinarum]PCD96476.1 hypothetical protein CKY18_01290 [Enterococcus gallinarum]